MIDDLRAELADLAPAGWARYSRLPGQTPLPALVVGLPDQIRWETAGFVEVLLPVVLVVSAGSEALLLSTAMEVARSYRGASGASFRTCRVIDLTEFGSFRLGAVDALSCAVNLSVLVPTP